MSWMVPTVVTNAVSGVVSTLFPVEAEFPEEIIKKDGLLHVDIASSVFGLVLASTYSVSQSPKMCMGKCWLYPSGKDEDAGKILPSVISAQNTSESVQDVCQGIVRTQKHDSREHLVFFNLAIPLLNLLYPTDSMDDDQNKTMKDTWGLVLDGIKILKESYKTELLKPLKENDQDTGKMIEKIYPEKKDQQKAENLKAFDLELNKNETKVELNWKNTLHDTFASWEYEIQKYIDMKKKEPKFTNLLLMGDAPDQAVVPENTIAFILNKIQRELKTFNVGNDLKFSDEDYKILQDLRRTVDSTILYGSVPKKLDSFLNKVRNLWTLDKINNVVESVKLINANMKEVCPNMAQRDVSINQLKTMLEEQALKYMLITRNELDELITSG